MVLAEGQPLVRSAVRRVLEADGFTITAEAEDADAAIDVVLERRPDLCVMAVMIPGGGIRATREITRRAPRTTVVMLTDSADRDHLLDAIRAGAAGYLLKDMDPERLPPALRGALAGEAAIPRALMGELISDLQAHGRRRTVVGQRGRAELTSREFEVLELLCDGLETGRIAERLSITAVTVRRHISEVVRKLGVRDREEAVALVRDAL